MNRYKYETFISSNTSKYINLCSKSVAKLLLLNQLSEASKFKLLLVYFRTVLFKEPYVRFCEFT